MLACFDIFYIILLVAYIIQIVFSCSEKTPIHTRLMFVLVGIIAFTISWFMLSYTYAIPIAIAKVTSRM